MDTSARRRSGWAALCVSSLARVLLGIVASLLLWAVAPSAAGLHPTVVMTGSMLPRLVPGDVVFSRTVPATDLQLGQTLLFADPDQPGHLRMHRWIGVTGDGLLVTKGDANPERDSSPVDRSAVVGVASLRVPYVARPVVWVADGRTVPLALTAIGLLVTVVAAFWFRAAPGSPDDENPLDGGNGAAAADAPADLVIEAATPAWPRRLTRVGATLLVVVGLGGTFATGADAATTRFTRATANPTSTWNAATYFSCGGAARALGARFAWPLGEASGTVATDITANHLDGTYAGGGSYGTPGPCGSDGTTGVTLNGTSGTVSVNATATNLPDLTLQVWFKSATTGRGGVLMSMTSGTTSTMAIGMTTTGTISFAVTAGGTKRLTTTTTYRDNTWHLATGVAGASGMTLYVDGVALGTNTTVTSTTAVTGTPRVGYGDASDLGTGTYDYYQGSVAFASLYKDSLSASEVMASYRAAS